METPRVSVVASVGLMTAEALDEEGARNDDDDDDEEEEEAEEEADAWILRLRAANCRNKATSSFLLSA